MTRRTVRVLMTAAGVAALMSLGCSPFPQSHGLALFGSHTQGVSVLGLAVFLIIVCFIYGYGAGRACVEDAAQFEVDQSHDTVERLMELLDSVRVDVRDAIEIGQREYAQLRPDAMADYLAVVLEDGSLSVRAQNRARAGLSPDQVDTSPANSERTS